MQKFIFETKNGEIFSSEISFEHNGWSYVVRETPADSLQVIRLANLATLGEAFDFIAKYLPGFDTDSNVADLDDLDCLLNNECDLEKTIKLTQIYGSDPAVWKMHHDKIFRDLLEEAIENYKHITKNGK